MSRAILILLLTSVLFLTSITAQTPKVSVYDLRCENLLNPLGTNTDIPRLSWKIKSGVNGTMQKKYQILVASKLSLLNEKDVDIWRSEDMSSESGILVPYAGEVLYSRSLCYWKVRIWDENDNITDWSEPAFFSIGLLDEDDWKGEYIGLASPASGQVSPQLRKTFTVKGKGKTLFLHINTLGYHEIYLNGKKVSDDVLTPAVVQFNKRSQALTYDISKSIKEGKNDIVLWLGKGWYSKGLPGVNNDGPLVRAQIEQLSGRDWETIVVTDSTWKGRNSGYSDTGTWRAHQFGGERVDGSLLLANLSASSLDKAAWGQVSIINNPVKDVTPQVTESNAVIKNFKPDTIISLGENKWLVDMGTTLTGWFSISFPQLLKGQEVIMQYSDHLEKSDVLYNQGQEDRYIASGGKSESFRNKFNYHGFRYVKISNLKSQPVKENITASLIHTNYRPASSFKCSDPDINAIHDMIFYTLTCLSLGGDLVDCPQIERLGYGGDGNASTATAQLMFDMNPLYSNWLQAWADCMRDDGGMPHTAPNPYPAGGGPYWCGFLITASWKTYQNYGDTRVLEKYYPEMEKWLGYVEKYSPTGLLGPWPDTDYRNWYLGDWAVPEGTDQKNEASVKLVNNCFVSVCYETMEKIAGVLGKTADIKKYSYKKEGIKKLINSELFNSTSKIYGSGSQIDLTYPLLAGIVPGSQSDAVTQNLHSVINKDHTGHFATGLVGIPVFTEWVVKNREVSLMYSMLKKRDYPGYLYMIDNGATTTWEHWNGARSRIHNCYNGIGTWFYEAVGGIRIDEDLPAYRHIFIDPQIPEGITWADATKETPYGTVSVKWKLEKRNFVMNVKIPAGSTAGVSIPKGAEGFKVNGAAVKAGSPYAEIESGNYEISYLIPDR